MKIQPAENEPVQPDYRGNEGWIIVAVGMAGIARIVDYQSNFGALSYMIDSVGGDNAEELGLDAWAEDPGVYRGQFKVWTTSVHDYDGSDNDMGFDLVGEWETLWEPGPTCDVCGKILDLGESFICSKHPHHRRCEYCNEPFDASVDGRSPGILLTDWCCPPCQKKRAEVAALGQNVFAAVMDEHNFGCKGPDCDVMVLVGGKSVRCRDSKPTLPTFEELDVTHSPSVWQKVVRAEQKRRAEDDT